MNEKIVIFKNDKIGDLIHAYNAIQVIINNNSSNKVTIFLSNYNSEMKFLFKSNNVSFKIISEKINIKDRIKLLFFFLTNNVKKVYILKPSNFLFYLPLIFYLKKIKFFGVCVNNKNYRRPGLFLRNLLDKLVINDRGSKKIRKPIHDLYMNLLLDDKYSKYKFNTINNKVRQHLQKNNHILVHYNKFKFNKLNLGLKELELLINMIGNFGKKIVLTNDLNDKKTNDLLLVKYSNEKKNYIDYYPNINAEDLFKLIGNVSLVISFHGMITSMAAIQNIKVIDLFNCDIHSKEDFYRYKNAYHEFVPKLNNYEFIIPKKQFNITINRIKNLLTNGRKINY